MGKRKQIFENNVPSKRKKFEGEEDEILAELDPDVIESDEELTELEKERRRLAKAKEYLEKVTKIVEEKEGDSVETREAISKQLKLEREHEVKKRKLAKLLKKDLKIHFLKGHKNAVTCVKLGPQHRQDGLGISAAKDCCIIRWDLNSLKKTKIFKGSRKYENGHSGHIYAMAISHDSRYLCTAGKDQVIKVWDLRTNQHVDELIGHYDDVTGLAMRKNTYELYSCSKDKSVRIWSVDDQKFMNTLYGHTSEILGIDCLEKETAITCGQDSTLRYWKMENESQLLFQSTPGSIDCCSMITGALYLSGSQSGDLSLWIRSKRKPIFTYQSAHGGKWISSVSCVRNSDLVMSGSDDGFLNFYKADPFSGISLMSHIPVEGFVTSIDMTNDDNINSTNNMLAMVGVSREHRLGRWTCYKNVKNGIGIVNLFE